VQVLLFRTLPGPHWTTPQVVHDAAPSFPLSSRSWSDNVSHGAMKVADSFFILGVISKHVHSHRTAIVVCLFGVSTGFAAAQSPSPDYFSASPISGKAPLIVKFCASAGIGIDFGDGTSAGMGIAPEGTCPQPGSAFTTHKYENTGAYKLKGFPCPGGNAIHCGAVASQANAITIEVID